MCDLRSHNCVRRRQPAEFSTRGRGSAFRRHIHTRLVQKGLQNQLWTLMPNELAPICDRVIYECLKKLPLKLHWHSEPTLDV